MIAIPGINIKAKIYESDRTLVYQGLRECDRQAVILKVLKLDYPLPQHLASYKQEYELVSSLDILGVIKAYSLEKYNNKLIIIFEDFEGESLKVFTDARKLALKDFLKIAIQLAEVLAQIHSLNVIHKTSIQPI